MLDTKYKTRKMNCTMVQMACIVAAAAVFLTLIIVVYRQAGTIGECERRLELQAERLSRLEKGTVAGGRSGNVADKKISAHTEELIRMKGELNRVSNQSKLNFLSVLLSGGVSTQDIYAPRIVLYEYPKGSVSGYVDIAKHNSDMITIHGSSTVQWSDRELRAVLLAFMKEFTRSFKENESVLKLENGSISISQDSYPLATYKNGVITLAGEKEPEGGKAE